MTGQVCAFAATCLGLVYLSMAGAPGRYLIVNAGALIIGLVLSVLIGTGRGVSTRLGILGLSLLLLATALFGISLEGARRWISVGGLAMQPSLIVLPAMILAFGVSRDRWSALGMVVAAGALALQPDRAMAGALAAGLGALFVLRRERSVGIALLAAIAGFVVTLVRADGLPAMPMVEGVYASAFQVHALAGLAVLVGTGLLLVPAVLGVAADRDRRAKGLVFGATWLAIIAAAALGNYPTPVVGYGSSAILGYVISLGWLSRREADRR